MRTTDDFLGDYEVLLREAAAARLRTRDRRLGVRPIARIAVPVLASLALVAALLAAPAGNPPTHATRPTATASPDPTPHGTSGKPSFAILAPGTPALSKAERDELRRNHAMDGLRMEDARLALRRDGVTAYVVPAAKDRVCLLLLDSTGTSRACGVPRKATGYVLWTRVGLSDRATAVYGLVPDGAHRVFVLEDDLGPRYVDVVNNVFVARLGHAPAKLDWTDATGSHSAKIAASPDWHDSAGPASTGRVDARAPVPNGNGREVGVIGYQTKIGRVCLAAGPIVDGRVGRYGPNGFSPLNPADSPGGCGDLRLTLARFGGAGYGHVSASAADLKHRQAIQFGLVKAASTRVRVTWRDGSVTDAAIVRVDPSAFQGAEAIYVAAGPTGIDTVGSRVELIGADGSILHTFLS